MVKDLSPDMAALVGCWCTTMLYGVNIVLYIGCLYVLVYKRKNTLGNRVLIATSSLQFLLATGHVATVMRALIEGFIFNARAGTELPYWINQGVPIHVAQEVLYIANSVVGDSILVWRLYVLWPTKRWVCIVPAVGVVAAAVCGAIAEVELSTLSPMDPLFLRKVTEWIVSTWGLSIFVQIIATGLITYRIWAISYRGSHGIGAHKFKHLAVIWTLVESGAFYTASTICLLVLFLAKMNAGAVIGDSLGQISSLVPTLIIVRVGLGLTHPSPTASKLSTISPGNMNQYGQIQIEIGVESSGTKEGSVLSQPLPKTIF